MKLIIPFSSTANAKKFVEKAKKLPYVTYAIDYQVTHGNKVAMVCGDFSDEQSEKLKSKKL